jgi:ribosomal protein S18 acetylase RimI-like enzyme
MDEKTLKEQVSIVPFDAQSPYLDGAVGVYTSTWPSNEEEIRAFILGYAGYPGFRGFVALLNGEVVGMGFGTQSLPGQWWHDKVAAHVGRDHPALRDAWVLVDLAVLEAYRGNGIGTLLHHALLESQLYRRALLSTEVSNAGSRRLYEQLGWSYLHPGFVFNPGQQPYAVMSKEVRHRTD